MNFINTKYKYLNQIIKSVVFLTISYLILNAILFLVFDYYNKKEFNKESWLQNKDQRYEMSENIIKSKLLIGKSKNEVISYLGIELNNLKEDNWQYYIGHVPSMIQLDPYKIVIEFQNERVVKVEIHQE